MQALLAVTPVQNASILPKPLQDLMLANPDIFVKDFEIDTKSARYAGEYVCQLPDISI